MYAVTYPAEIEHLSVAHRLLCTGRMSRWLLVVFLTLFASVNAWAQAPATVKAQELATAAERRVVQLQTEHQVLATRYEGELSAIDRLKQKKKSWNQERELKDKLSAANETATKLEKIDATLVAARAQLAGARRVLVSAIDVELAAQPVAARAEALRRLRDQLVPQIKPSNVHRIAIPNLEVDPGADPEDLDAQAAELRQIEAELARQVTSLDKQSKDLERVAELRRSHDRTATLDRREDNTPTRVTPSETGAKSVHENDSAQEPAPTSTGGGEAPPPGSSGDTFESEASVVLQDVVDPSTIDTLANAQRSGDPGKRSKAAAKTRDAVKAKLDLLRMKRAAIEARAKALRK
jgi:hypothetical protein